MGKNDSADFIESFHSDYLKLTDFKLQIELLEGFI